MPEQIRIPLRDLAAGSLAELGVMITGYDPQNGTAWLAPRALLECGHPAVCLRANVDGSGGSEFAFCLACRRLHAPAARRSKPAGVPAGEAE